jgi:hypothetical protein
MHAILESQFRAGLRMLRQAIAACPDSLWNDPDNDNRTWRIAYHALFYTHLYLSPSDAEFVPWEHAITNGHFLRAPIGDDLNTREQILAYAMMIDDRLTEAIAAVPLDTEESGFDWVPFSRMELHIYNIRHLQHHVGQLIERLRANGIGDQHWIGRGVSVVEA